MRIPNRLRLAAPAALLFSASLVVSGCATSTTGIEGSRHTLYPDVTSLAADSSAVVDVVVESQEVVQAEIPYTLSTVTVVEPFQPKALAANLDAAAPVAAAETLVIRQLGSTEEVTVPAPLLKVGERYLLFVTATMMEGEASSQFYVTGVSAGIYESEIVGEARAGEVGTYTRVDPESGDTLPATLSASELLG
ncbi:hypothetical protein [Microbacterium sp. NPDC087665]|uniref:hypothetical protein n=1 Tax=Microbacterium sp. NPDC087665 TaxID=3364194 RepID=UPI0037F51BC7